MSRPFFGVGVGLPVSLDPNGQLNLAEYEVSIRQSIWIILSTAKGERVMRPEFGCEIYDLVFETPTITTADRISRAIQEALLEFEPRIDVLDVRVNNQSDEAGEKLFDINYQVRATNNAFNLVYPFYLERSAG